MTSSSSAQKDKKILFSSFSKSFKKSSACCCCWNSIAKACICCCCCCYCCCCCCCCCCNTCKTSLCFFCNSKFDCLVYEMLYIKDIKPSLNTQADSIRAKLFTWHFRTFFFSLIVFLTLGIIPTGPANVLCIVSNFIYSLYTLYFFTFQVDNGVT